MNAPSKDVVALLNAESSLGLSSPTNLDYGIMPDTPDAFVTVYDGPGFSPRHTIDDANAIERPGVQVLVRGDPGDYNGAYALARAIKLYLHGLRATITGGTLIVSWVGGEIMFIDWDDRRRPRLSVNFNLSRTSS